MGINYDTKNLNLEQEQTLKTKIKIVRAKLKLSQKDFGKKLGVSRIAVSYWESNSKKHGKPAFPSTENIIKIANLANVSFEWLINYHISVKSFYEKVIGEEFDNLSRYELDKRSGFGLGLKHDHLTIHMTSYLKKLEQNNLYNNCSMDNAKLAQWFFTKLMRNLKVEQQGAC